MKMNLPDRFYLVAVDTDQGYMSLEGPAFMTKTDAQETIADVLGKDWVTEIFVAQCDADQPARDVTEDMVAEVLVRAVSLGGDPWDYSRNQYFAGINVQQFAIDLAEAAERDARELANV